MHDDDLDAALDALTVTLGPAADRDWLAATGTGDLDAWHTAEHLGDCLLSYAAQLVMRPQNGYVRFLAEVEKDATPAEALDFAVTGGRILASTIRTASPDARAYHPTGLADPAGFAGMGCVEVLIHGEDVARGLGLTLDPPRDVCARVLARMFPHHEVSGLDPWTALLWVADRAELPGRDRQTGWRWRGAPPGE